MIRRILKNTKRNLRGLTSGLAIVTLLTFASSAHAKNTLWFEVLNGPVFESDIQITVDLTFPDNETARFEIINSDESIRSAVTAAYIEALPDNIFDALANGQIVEPQKPGVAFQLFDSPVSPPDDITNHGGPWAGELLTIGTTSPGGIENGLNPGESVSVEFDYDGITNLMWALDEELFRFVVRLQPLPDDEPSWFADSGAVPEPTTAATLLLLATGIIHTRRPKTRTQ